MKGRHQSHGSLPLLFTGAVTRWCDTTGRREVALLVSRLALCPALISVLIFLNLLMDGG